MCAHLRLDVSSNQLLTTLQDCKYTSRSKVLEEGVGDVGHPQMKKLKAKVGGQAEVRPPASLSQPRAASRSSLQKRGC